MSKTNFNEYNNNIVAYRDNNTGEWITPEEYDEILKEKPLNLKKLSNIQAFSENDRYYRFFKEEIDKKLARQIKIEI